MSTAHASSVKITGEMNDTFAEILTTEAIEFVTELELEFRSKRKHLLEQRKEIQASIDAGGMPVFLDSPIRDQDWKVDPVPNDLQQRRVEITGPPDRKMVINALNSGSDCFMADFEDSNSPTWSNNIQGQINLRDAVNGTIEFTNAAGKHYKLNENPATLLVRARGWHLDEKNFTVEGEPVSGGIMDFGLYFYHNVNTLLEKGSGPYFYLPKLQNHHEAGLWNDVFEMAQEKLGICRGTIKATVLLEHILAAFETEEILKALQNHSAGLNCGRWDYIFSIIKVFRNNPNFILPDRSSVTMSSPCMEAYCKEVVRACHKRGAHAMGGMAAQIPIKNDPDANELALYRVKADKEREVKQGHDGTWVAHPGLVGIAMEEFKKMTVPHQINYQPNYEVTAEQLLEVPQGDITDEGLRHNIRVGVQYIESWIRGNGCVPIYNLMEDAATAEISRSQIWQWIKHSAATKEGKTVDAEYFLKALDEEGSRIRSEVGEDAFNNGRFLEAGKLFAELSTAPEMVEFLTIPAYDLL